MRPGPETVLLFGMARQIVCWFLPEKRAPGPVCPALPDKFVCEPSEKDSFLGNLVGAGVGASLSVIGAVVQDWRRRHGAAVEEDAVPIGRGNRRQGGGVLE